MKPVHYHALSTFPATLPTAEEIKALEYKAEQLRNEAIWEALIAPISWLRNCSATIDRLFADSLQAGPQPQTVRVDQNHG